MPGKLEVLFFMMEENRKNAGSRQLVDKFAVLCFSAMSAGRYDLTVSAESPH
jgi:hypothetical protein